MQYYHKYSSNSSGEGYLKAAQIFGSASSKVANLQAGQVFSSNDLRYYASCYDVTSDGSLDVRKMISSNALTSKTSQRRETSVNYGGINQNYIIYRLTDIMLMKAEALVQQVDTTMETTQQKELLRVPFTLVQAVNTRSLSQDNLTDSMTWSVYQNYDKEQMELLVMQERLRELCFEGKRWYDLMRYSYRHVDYDGSKYDKLLVDLSESNSLGTISQDMKKLMIRSRGSDGSGVAAKMQNEAYLYMPVPNSDIIVCPLLRQNPAYKNTNDFEKSY
jgi:hypothetical protein